MTRTTARPELTRHQETALRLIGDGLTNEQVGEEMGCSARTAKYFADVLRNKTGVATKRELIPFAREYFRGKRG